MATETTNFKLIKDAQTDYYNIDTVNANLDKIDKALGNTALFEKAGGTAAVITLTGIEFVDGRSKTFIVSASNNGADTKINGKPLYKPGTTQAPNLVAGKAVTVWYDAAGDCFFIKASASGTASPSDVLAEVPFSNEDGEQVGTMPNNGAVSYTLPINGTYSIPAGYHNGNGKVTQSIPTKGAATYTPGTSDQTISAGQYLTGAQTIKGDANLISDNIKAGKSIFGVSGKSSVVDTADANAVASQILYGNTAYVKGSKTTGSMNDMRWNNYSATDKYANGNGTLSLKPPAGYYEPTGASSSPSDIKGWLSVYDANFKAANIKKGVSIFGITGSLEEGKKFVSGTTGSGSVVSPRTFYRLDDSPESYKGLMVSGLTFTPSLIIIFAKITEYSVTNYKTIVYAKGKTYTRTDPVVTIHEVNGPGSYGQSAMIFKGDNLVTSNGFTIPICSLSGLVDYYRWEAYE